MIRSNDTRLGRGLSHFRETKATSVEHVDRDLRTGEHEVVSGE